MKTYETTRAGFQSVRRQMIDDLRATTPIYRGQWQSRAVADNGLHNTHEICGASLTYQIPATVQDAQHCVQPDLPWAEDHFQERVGGEPLNPPPSEKYWPHHNGAHGAHQDENRLFDHTYPERFWPKLAGRTPFDDDESVGGGFYNDRGLLIPAYGVRFDYGDLSDVVLQLVRQPFTRQAFLPVWFPEDTGAKNGIRVPCTIGYHFMRDRVHLDCHYFIRSCDVFRHLHNDVYMAVRLTQWILDRLREQETNYPLTFVGRLYMSVSNLHLMQGDVWRAVQ